MMGAFCDLVISPYACTSCFRRSRCPAHSGCDDLLPIMSYVLIKAAPPHVRSQVAYLSEFMNQASGMGLEGYAFATLETALDHVEGIVLLTR